MAAQALVVVMKKSISTAASPLAALAVAAWVLSFGLSTPLSAQSSDPYLNYLDHVSLDFAHSTVVSSNVALYYRDYRGNLQTPTDGTSDPFYLFATKAFHRVAYDSGGFNRQFGEVGAETAWYPAVAFPNGNIALGAGTEVSYTPRQTPYPPPTNGPDPVYHQPAMMTGARNALYDYGLTRQTRENLVTVSTDPATPPYTPGNALLVTGPNSTLLTTNGGIYALDTTDGNGQVTPFITAQGSGPGQLSNPSALNIGPDGLLYVLDSGNNRIQKFDRTTGAYRGEFSLPGGVTVSPTSLAISTEGHLYLGDGVGGGFVFNLTGTLLSTFHPPAADPSWVDGGLIAGSSVGVGSFLSYDGKGNVFTYVEGQGLFMYRDPAYNELNYVNLNIMSAVTSAPGNSIVNSLSFDDDRAVLGDRRNGTLIIVEPMQVRTGNIYTEAGAVATIEGGSIVTPGDVTKINRGTLILNNANTYTGRTIVQDGTLVVNGSVAGEVVVQSGASVGGRGVIGALTLGSGSTISPGNSPGTLHAGDTTIAGDTTFHFEVNNATGTPGTNYDLLAISGTLTLTATSANPLTIDVTSLALLDNTAGLAANFDPAATYSFTFLTTTGGITGFAADEFLVTTTNFENPFTGTWSVALTNGGYDLTLNYAGVASAVPEPSTYAAIAGTGALGLAAWRRRKAAPAACRH